jgi:outer membrane protein assembly factor BamB
MNSDMPTPRKPLRLWPGVAIAIVQLLVMIGGPVVARDSEIPVGLLGAMAGALLIFLWWLLLSRARWTERVGAAAVIIGAIFVARAIAHHSMVGAGQGMLMYFLPLPFFALALVAWAAAARPLQGGARLASMAAAIVVVVAGFAMIRTDGVMGGGGFQFHWRWTPTAEERLLAQAKDEPTPVPPPVVAAPAEPAAAKPESAPAAAVPAPAPAPAQTDAAATAAPTAPATSAGPAMSERRSGDAGPTRVEWPGFRGPDRDSVIRGVRINTDWSAAPPVQVWRRPIGPGWSSFSVSGDLLYTQEQRGEEEMVSCYRVSTGEPVWRHRDPVRFYESNGGAGPRGTPTINDGRVYTFGATGILNALDARTGARLWSHNVAAEGKVTTPTWGFSSSPLVIDDVVIVAASGVLAGYDRVTGKPRWLNPSKGGSYSSPHRVTIDGVEQVLFLGGPGVMSVTPADGTLLWEHKWEGGAIVQPAVTEDGDILINAMSMMGGLGTRRLHVTRAAEGWKADERWTSRGLKPYFNDFVVHKGHAFGFDGSILSCINLEDGERKWKGGRYGNGQLVLLADQDVLLVISEDGELALVSATPDKHTELAKFRVFDAKTWNHPVIVGDLLLVRNGEEMAAFKLAPAGAVKTTVEDR